MRQPLTKRQQEIYDYVRDYTFRNLYSPSIKEILEEFNLSSKSTIARHLSALQQKGYLIRYNYGRGSQSRPYVLSNVSVVRDKTWIAPMPLTDDERRVYEEIVKFVSEYKQCPSALYLSKAVGISHTSISLLLYELSQKKYIDLSPKGIHRAIKLNGYLLKEN